MELVNPEHLTSKRMKWDRQLIIPIGDIQLQANRDAVDLDRLKADIAFGIQHDAWFIGMGDYIDQESPSNRKALVSAGFYDSIRDALDLQAEQLESELMDILKPTRGRWLGLLEGHHYHVHQDGTTTDTRLAQYLDAPFLGTSAYVSLEFDPEEDGKRSSVGHPRVNIWCHHGRAGGKLMSTPINQLEHVVKGFEADIYLVGHHHKASAARISRIYPSFGRRVGMLRNETKYLIACGAYLRGWVPGHKADGRASGLYAERGMMNPLALGGVRIWVKPSVSHGVGKTEIHVEI